MRSCDRIEGLLSTWATMTLISSVRRDASSSDLLLLIAASSDPGKIVSRIFLQLFCGTESLSQPSNTSLDTSVFFHPRSLKRLYCSEFMIHVPAQSCRFSCEGLPGHCVLSCSFLASPRGPEGKEQLNLCRHFKHQKSDEWQRFRCSLVVLSVLTHFHDQEFELTCAFRW